MFTLSPLHELLSDTSLVYPVHKTTHLDTPFSDTSPPNTSESSLTLDVTKPVRPRTIPSKYRDFTDLPGHLHSSSVCMVTTGTSSSSSCTYTI